MSAAAFWLLALIITVYVLLDGYDLGIATITPLVARTPSERVASMRAIGPYWNANEVWLIAGGGALFALFPKAYASAFSGFYLPFIVALWLFMVRGIAMELRDHFASTIWRDFWDFSFSASSTLLILVFGVTIGNLLRGVPLDHDGYFTGTFGFLLNPFAGLVAILAVLALAAHGALFLTLRVDGPPAERARVLVVRLVPAIFVAYVVLTVTVFSTIGLRSAPAARAILPFLAIVALGVELFAALRGKPWVAFGASCAFLVLLLFGAAVEMYPYLLPGFPERTMGLSVLEAGASPAALATALAVSIAGLCIVVAYAAYAARAMRAKISL